MDFNKFFKTINIEQQVKLSNCIFPKVYTPSHQSSFIMLEQQLILSAEQIIKQLNQIGVIIFRGFDIKHCCQAAAVLNKMGIKPFQYIGGNAVRKLIIGSKQYKNDENIQFFTANEAPPQQPIPFHNQLLQNKIHPQYLAFYCCNEAETGGSTPVISCEELYRYISSKHPEFLQKLEEKKLRYIRVAGAEDNPNSPIGQGWKHIFKVNTHEEAQKVMAEKGYEFQWLNNQDDDCKLISKELKGIALSFSGKKVFCNQMIAVYRGWIDQKNKPSNCLKYGDFSQIPVEILEDIAVFADKNKVAVPWIKGDLMLIDNYMAMHSRQPFTGKHRKIYASLLKGRKHNTQQLNLTLRSGQLLPMIGFGTWKIPKQKTSDVVYTAINAGYRLLDCACDYGNELEVGLGLQRAIDEKLIKRADIFLTSKLWNTYHRPQNVRKACQKTLKDLNVNYLDLYLIHFPISLKFIPFQQRYPPQWVYDSKSKKPYMFEDPVPIIQTWKAMQQLVKDGLVRNIGVCNFTIALLRDLIHEAEIIPSVLQVQIHPYLTQKNLIRYCREQGVQLTSFSTLGAQSYTTIFPQTEKQLIIQEEVINTIAKNHGKSAYQIVLRWAIQQGLAIIPKSIRQQKMKQNRQITNFYLTQQEMGQISTLNKNRRFNDPGYFCQKAFGTFFPIYD